MGRNVGRVGVHPLARDPYVVSHSAHRRQEPLVVGWERRRGVDRSLWLTEKNV